MKTSLLRMVTLIAMLVIAPLAGIAVGQDAAAQSAFATGLNTPATHFDRDKNPLLEIQVTGIEGGWQGFGEYEAPLPGQQYVKVDLSITNVAAEPGQFLPSFVEVFDSMGFPGDLSSFQEAEGIWDNSDDMMIDPGQTLEGSLVYALGAEHSIAWVTYFPSSPQVMIFVEEIAPDLAAATDLNAPAMLYSEDRAPQAEMQVQGIELNWQGSTSQIPPEQQFVKVDLAFTNLTDQPVTLMPYFMSLRDGWGRSASVANVSSDYWSAPDEITLNPGESASGSVIFLINADSDVVSVSYRGSQQSFVYLGE